MSRLSTLLSIQPAEHLAEDHADGRLRYSVSDSEAPSSSPSTEMRSERRKWRSLVVNGASAPSSPAPAAASSESLARDLVQADRSLKHQQHVKPMLADIVHDAGDLLAFDYRLMDRLTKLLNQFAHTRCQGYLQRRRPARTKPVAARSPFTLRPPSSGSNCRAAKKRQNRSVMLRCYHHNGMRPQSIGRALGIGLRVAGRMAGERVAASATAVVNAPGSGQPSNQAAEQVAERARSAGQVGAHAAGKATKNVARGIGGFLRPFGRVGAIVWLEVTGLFFFLFVIVFARALWMYRTSYEQGPDHKKFLVSVPLLLLFLYLSASSFWRARRK